MSLKNLLVLFLTLCYCWSCKDTNSTESPKITESQLDSIRMAEEKQQAEAANTKIFAWVNNLRVRQEPDTKSKIIIELQEGDSIIYLKEQTDFTQKVSLRGKSFDEPWLKVKTQNGDIGWVYGGGVKFYAPKAVRKPMLYDKCFEYLKEYRQVKFQSCFEEEQAKQFRRTKGIVSSSDKELNLRLLTGKRLALRNDTSSHRPVRYRFYYYYPKMSSFVVEATFEDGTDFLIINDKTGKKTTVWGYPKPSPENEKWLASFTDDKGEKGTSGGIQILEETSNGLEIIWQEFTKTELHVPYWLDEETIEVTAKRKGSSKTTIKTLEKKGRDWVWQK